MAGVSLDCGAKQGIRKQKDKEGGDPGVEDWRPGGEEWEIFQARGWDRRKTLWISVFNPLSFERPNVNLMAIMIQSSKAWQECPGGNPQAVEVRGDGVHKVG